MSDETKVQRTVGEPSKGTTSPASPCILVIFGASGDLTKRLLMPALYNLACDGLLAQAVRHRRHRDGPADHRRSSASA